MSEESNPDALLWCFSVQLPFGAGFSFKVTGIEQTVLEYMRHNRDSIAMKIAFAKEHLDELHQRLLQDEASAIARCLSSGLREVGSTYLKVQRVI